MRATFWIGVLAASSCLWVHSAAAQEPPVDPSAVPGEASPAIAANAPADPFSAEVTPAADPGAALEHARSLLALGAIADAAQGFRAVLAAQPENLGALQGLRLAAVRAERPDVVLDMTVQLIPLLHGAGDRDLADQRLNDLITLKPDHPQRKAFEQLLGRHDARDKGATSLATRLRSVFGVVAILGIALLMSNNRRAIRWKVVAWGLGLQLLFAVLILWTPPGRWVFSGTQAVIDKILRFTDFGAGFLFGKIYGGVAPTATRGPVQFVDGTTGDLQNLGVIFALHVLPTIIFFGALMSVLYHVGFLQRVVRAIASVMNRTMGTSGAESLSTAGNIFLGQTEAPLLIKPYVPTMTNSELITVMTGGFATVAGGVLAAYVRFGIDAGHLLAASVMNAPAAIILSKMIFPETGQPETMGGRVQDPERTTSNIIDAAAAGAADGLKLALNVAAMLMAFIALIAMVNWMISPMGISLREIFGWLFTPLAWAMGVDTKDLVDFGNLIGTKLSINEFVAYIDLGHLKSTLEPRSFVIATYALCGFANFSSIGIQIGGISGIAPERRGDLARIGLRAMFAGALASCLTASIAGILI